MKNNKGFTLIELVVSAAILGIVAMAAGAFIVAGTRVYSSLNDTLRLQYESQLAMAQLQEYTVDCISGLAWDGSRLYIVNNDEVDVFAFDSASEKIYYGHAPASESLSPDIAADLAAKHVTGMNVVLEEKRANITLNMARNNKSYEATQVIALRNQPKIAENWPDLVEKMKK